MVKTLGITLKRITSLLLVLSFLVAAFPTTAFADGETFTYGDAAKKTIVMTGGELDKVESPDSLEFKQTAGNKYVLAPTDVKLQNGGTCKAAGEITVTGGTNMTFTPTGSTCPFMNQVTKSSTVTANLAQTGCNGAGTLAWIICPITNMTENVIKLTSRAVEALLYMEPITLNTGKDNAIYGTWELIRNIANIVFIIIFLIIIYSQATSMGMSNYGIKRTLPRLLIMAVLVNISYFLCAFALDVANLIGAGVKGIVQFGIDSAPKPDLGKEEWDGSYAGFITALVVVIIALALGPLFPLISTLFSAVALTIVVIFVALVARQVLITLLIIISPLAFAMALLPNTEGWFTKWRKLFIKLLISYPIVMFALYGSVLAATVITASLMPAAE